MRVDIKRPKAVDVAKCGGKEGFHTILIVFKGLIDIEESIL